MENKNELNERIDQTIRDLTNIGRSWASAGLSMGKLALETSAKTLQTTAQTLGDLSAKFREPENKEPTTTAE
ncbi:MAG: hypothetical protein V1754_10065 [Pseudomonadota bacterium]